MADKVLLPSLIVNKTHFVREPPIFCLARPEFYQDYPTKNHLKWFDSWALAEYLSHSVTSRCHHGKGPGSQSYLSALMDQIQQTGKSVFFILF